VLGRETTVVDARQKYYLVAGALSRRDGVVQFAKIPHEALY